MRGVDDSPYQWCGELTVIRGVFQKVFRQQLPESSIQRVGDSPYHWYAELSIPRITDTRSRLPDSLMRGVVDSPYHRCGEHITIAIFLGTKDACNNRQVWIFFSYCRNFNREIFLDFFPYVLYSTMLHLPPIRLRRRMLGSNPGLLLLWHWQSEALTTRLDLIHYSARSHPHSARSHPHSARSYPHSARSYPQSARSHPHSTRSYLQSARSHPFPIVKIFIR
jgi:hypothetical protein